ncbi:unnamed protein product [Alternaria alternata]
MDTPHRGLDTNVWKAVYGSCATPEAEEQLDLWHFGLIDLETYFIDICTNLSITSIYASNPVDTAEGSVHVVQEFSSALLAVTEKRHIFSGTSHITMCKFANQDHNYTSILGRITAELSRWERAEEKGREVHVESENVKIMDWIKPAKDTQDHQYLIHDEAQQRFLQGTGKWLTDSITYQGWLRHDSRLAWMRGYVGSGKTTLFSHIISDVTRLAEEDPNTRVLWFYCSHRYGSTLDIYQMLLTLISGLCTKEYIPLEMKNIWQAASGKSRTMRMMQAELKKAFLAACAEKVKSTGAPLGKTYIMIDGVDEMPNEGGSQEYLLSMIRDLAAIENSLLHILIAGRDRPGGDIDTRLSIDLNWSPFTLIPDIIRKDIDLFARTSLQDYPFTLLCEKSRQAIIDSIVGDESIIDRRNGMFLWASLHLKRIGRLRDFDYKSVLSLLSELPESLNETYARVASKLEGPDLRKVRNALKWLAFARRPLLIEELAQTTAPTTSDLEEIDLVGTSTVGLLRLLEDLTVVQPNLSPDRFTGDLATQTYTIVLAHASVRDFLLLTQKTASRKIWSSIKQLCFTQAEAQVDIANRCLGYLYAFNKINTTIAQRPLLQYAWYNWEKHITESQCQGSYDRSQLVREVGNKFLENMKIEERMTGPLVTMAINDTSNSACYRITCKSPTTLQDALRLPFFHPGFEDFYLPQARKYRPKARARSGGVVNNVVSTRLSEGEMYKYKSLPDSGRYIRVLELLPGLGDASPIYCRLRTMDLDDPSRGSYDALSYLWGGPQAKVTIYVDRVEHDVPENLASILRRLRAQERQTVTVWVDQLCINQCDKHERSQQVYLAPAIYSQAQRVVISIDSDDERHAKSIGTIKKLAVRFDKATSQDIRTIEDVLLRDSEDLIDMLHIFRRHWWRRMWAVQELVLATSATLLFGSISLDFDELRGFLESEVMRQAIENVKCYLNPKHLPGWRAATATALTRTEYQEDRVPDLFKLIWRFRFMKVFDPRDMIYGLLGIARLQDSVITPDYYPDSSESFANLLKTLSSVQGLIDCLSICSGYERTRISWLPELSLPTCMVPLRLGIFETTQDLPKFSASGHWKADFSISGLMAHTSAFRCGVVQEVEVLVAPVWRTLQGKRNFTKTISIDGMYLDSSEESWHQTHSSDIHEVAMAYTVGQWSPTSSDEQETLSVFEALEAILESDIQDDTSTSLSDRDDIFRFRHGRKIVLLSFGRLALVPAATAPDDVIVIIPGGAVPYVVRLIDSECCKFIGECYIRGLMEGQVPRAHSDPKMMDLAMV